MSFEKELEDLINRHSQENASNTPDFILAQYTAGCLAAFNTAVQQRETWYGRDARPGAPITSGTAGVRRFDQMDPPRCVACVSPLVDDACPNGHPRYRGGTLPTR